MRARVASIFVVLALAGGAGCSSDVDAVCEDIGNCSQGGSNAWITSCQAETDLLRDEAATVACTSQFDAYFSCAKQSYSCRGATALFPGCGDPLAALNACLTAATANTSCARLQTATSVCSMPGPDAGTGPGTPPACTAARDCQASCYLTKVGDVCAPRVDELQLVTSCAATCPL